MRKRFLFLLLCGALPQSDAATEPSPTDVVTGIYRLCGSEGRLPGGIDRGQADCGLVHDLAAQGAGGPERALAQVE